MRPTLLLSFLLLLASCEARFDWPWLKKEASAPSHPSGTSGVEDRSVGAFAQVRFEGVGSLVFDASVPAGTVRVKADQDLLAKIQTSVSGDTLVLREDGLQGPGAFDLEFRVAAPAGLSKVTLAGLGSVGALEALTASDLTLVLEGMGRLELAVAAKTVTIRQQGQGELVVRGTAESVDVKADGLGRVDVAGLATKAASVESNGLGEVSVYASEKLRVRANGLGAVHFSGHPAVTDVQTKGMTTVEAAD